MSRVHRRIDSGPGWAVRGLAARNEPRRKAEAEVGVRVTPRVLSVLVLIECSEFYSVTVRV